MKNTTNYGFPYLEVGDKIDFLVQSEAVQRIDTAIYELYGTVAENDVQLQKQIDALAGYAAPVQDASVEGEYLLFARHKMKKATSYESADVTFLVRNRTAANPIDGMLRVRVRYGRTNSAYIYAQIYWTFASNVDVQRFYLCYNNERGEVELYVRAPSAYDGYIFKVIDMGTNSDIVDFTAWELVSSTTGITQLPASTDGWATVQSSYASATAAVDMSLEMEV